MSNETTQRLIGETCDRIRGMLLEKNRAYGDSALRPVRVFSRSDEVEQLRVRLDDKLSRVARGAWEAVPEEDMVRVLEDIVGYCVLLTIALRRQAVARSR